MKPPIAVRVTEVESRAALFARSFGSRMATNRFDRDAGSGLSAYMRASQRRHHSLPRWLMLTVVAGAFVALAFVQLLVR
jgi:hypothetical protein